MRNLKFWAASYEVSVEPNKPIEMKNGFRGFDVIAHYDKVVIKNPEHSTITIQSFGNDASIFYEDKIITFHKGNIEVLNAECFNED